jgi:hypothetical protein
MVAALRPSELLPSGNVSFPAGFVRGSTCPTQTDVALNGIWP